MARARPRPVGRARAARSTGRATPARWSPGRRGRCWRSGREGLETALFLWAATAGDAGSTGSIDRRPARSAPLLGLLIAVVLGYLIYRGALQDQPDPVLHLDRRLPDRRRGRRARLRRPRPAGGRRPAGPEHPGLRRLAARPARPRWYGTLLKGVVQLLPRHHLARGRSSGCSTSCPTMTRLPRPASTPRGPRPRRPAPPLAVASGGTDPARPDQRPPARADRRCRLRRCAAAAVAAAGRCGLHRPTPRPGAGGRAGRPTRPRPSPRPTPPATVSAADGPVGQPRSSR